MDIILPVALLAPQWHKRIQVQVANVFFARPIDGSTTNYLGSQREMEDELDVRPRLGQPDRLDNVGSPRGSGGPRHRGADQCGYVKESAFCQSPGQR